MIAIALLLAAPAQTQIDLNDQAYAAYKAADAAMNVEYRRLTALMAALDKERDADLKYGSEKPDGDPGYRAALVAAQRIWLAYRDANCIVAKFEFRGGSARGMAFAECMTDVTKARTIELKQQFRSLSPK